MVWIVRNGEKASTSDIVFKSNPVVSITQEIVTKIIGEVQCKATKTVVTQKLLENEVAKSVVYRCPQANYKSCFLVLCAAGPENGLDVQRYCTDNLLVVVPSKALLGAFVGGQEFLEKFLRDGIVM